MSPIGFGERLVRRPGERRDRVPEDRATDLGRPGVVARKDDTREEPRRDRQPIVGQRREVLHERGELPQPFRGSAHRVGYRRPAIERLGRCELGSHAAAMNTNRATALGSPAHPLAFLHAIYVGGHSTRA